MLLERQRRIDRVGGWKVLHDLSPDLALLQEVTAIPPSIDREYQTVMHRAAWPNAAGAQKFSTAILVRGHIGPAIPLASEWDWVNREIEHFSGNLVARHVTLRERPFRVLSAYSPAWPVPRERLRGIDVSAVKLTLNPEVWVTEILWASLRNSCGSTEPPWIVGGDLNASETFDQRPSGPRGNRELLDRMEALGLRECLREAQGRLVPTFRHSSGQVVHQMDHLFVSESLAADLIRCETGDETAVFGGRVSDHLPIVADFRDG